MSPLKNQSGISCCSNGTFHAKQIQVRNFFGSSIVFYTNTNLIAYIDFLLQGVYSKIKKERRYGMAQNKFQTEEMMARCVPMASVQGVLGGKWKILILWYIAFYKVQRFGQLMRRLDGITQSSLTKQLRELEQDGFIHREIYKEIPPKVEYSLTELGQSFTPILNQMMIWSEAHLCPPDYINPFGEDGRLPE